MNLKGAGKFMNDILIRQVSENQNIKVSQVEVVLNLLSEGNTVPFIARYRKEMTGSLDEEQIRAIEKEYDYANNLEKRKEDIIRLIDEKGMLTEELKASILIAEKLVDLEDIYRPYKEKKKTKATEAIKKGLEPLAKLILTFPNVKNLDDLAMPYITEDVPTIADAFTGAGHIISEIVSDNASYRKWVRDFTYRTGKLVAQKKKDAVEEKYEVSLASKKEFFLQKINS